MIVFKNVKKAFGDRILFDALDFEINDGEFVVFSGKSGCGKSTLLHMMGGLESVTEGTICVDSFDVTGRGGKTEFFRSKVGFLFQNYALVENKTVRQNLELIHLKARSGITVAEALERVGLGGYEDKKVYVLSGGEQQRVAVARLLYKSCSVILADEPTASLDHDNAVEIMGLLKKMNEEGRTVVVVTHNTEYLSLSNRKWDIFS